MKHTAMIEIRKLQGGRSDGVKQAYEDIYSGRARIASGTGIRHRESFYRWILKLLHPVPGRMFLDIACGEGVLPKMAQAANLRAHGVDIAEAAIRIAVRESSARYAISAGEHLPFPDGVFDYVTNIGSLEHFMDPYIGAQETARVLARDGTLCVLVPNTFGLLTNVYEVLRKGHVVDDDQPLQRYASRGDWEEILTSVGLETTRVLKYEREWPSSLADIGWYLRHPKPLVRLLLTPMVPVNLGANLVFLCRHRSRF